MIISKQPRNPAIELYRVLLMFLIVLSHAASFGYWNHAQGRDAAYPCVFWVYAVLINFHVDGFLSISGWFGVHFSFSRFARLWGVIFFYSVFSVAYSWIAHGRLSTADFAGGWFGRTYLYFIFIAPLMNCAINYMLEMNRRSMFITWIIFDIAVVLNWLPYHLFSGVSGDGAGSFSIMNFIVVYVNARLLKESGIYAFVQLRHIVLVCFMFVVGGGGCRQ